MSRTPTVSRLFISTPGCRTWLDETLRRCGLSRPDGRPLFAYQVERARFDELVEALRRLAGTSMLEIESESVSAAFCMYVAEWWRRTYSGGPWTWATPVHNLGWSLTQARLARMTEQGLHYWGREVVQHEVQRAFLGTLASEGGLPLQAIREGAPLQRYVKSLMQDIENFGSANVNQLQRFAAERGERVLPRSFRNPSIYEVAAALARFAWDYGGSDAKAPGHDLRLELSARPSWRNRLPLSLEDEVAVEFVRALLTEATQLRAGADRAIRVRTTLSIDGDAATVPRLRRRLVLPAASTEGSVRSLLGEDVSPPGRFDLFVVDDTGTSRTLAAFARYGDRYRITSFGTDVDLSYDASLEVGLWVGLGEQVLRVTVIGASALAPDLPWIFAPAGKAQSSPNEWELHAQGSLRTAHTEVLIAVDEDFRVRCGEGGDLRALPSSLEGRRMFVGSGHLIIEGPDGRFSVRTAARAEDDTSGQYVLVGSRWEIDRDIFTEMPTVRRVRADGTFVECPRNELSWRPIGMRGAWRPFTQRARGSVRVRHMVGGELMAELRTGVVPTRGRVAIKPEGAKRGRLVLTGFEGGLVGVRGVTPPEAKVTAESGGAENEAELSLVVEGPAPTQLQLEVLWGQQERLMFTAPFPAEGCRFVSRKGSELPSGSSAKAALSLNRMGGVIAEGRSHSAGAGFVLKGQLYTYEGPVEWGTFDRDLIPTRDRVTYQLDLGAVRTAVARLFSFTDDIGAFVELRLEGGRGWAPRVRARRFVGDVAYDPSLGTFLVSCDDASDAFELDRCEAIHLEDPGLRVALVREFTGSGWRLPYTLRPGVWLIFAFAGDWAGWRPAVHEVPWEEGPADAMTEAIRTPLPETRKELFAAVVKTMVADSNAPGWQVFDTYVHQTADVPPVVFDLVRAVAKHVKAVVMALLRSPDASVPRLWEMFEDMGVVWETVPAAVWLEVAQNRYREMEGLTASLDRGFREKLLRDVLSLLDSDEKFPRQRLATLSFIAALVHHHLHRHVTQESAFLLGLVENSNERALLYSREVGRIRVCQNLANAQWPSWRPFKDEVASLRLPSAFAGLLLEASQTHQELVLNAPVIAAIAAARGFPLNRALLIRIKMVSDTQREWFEEAYHNTFGIALRLALSAPSPSDGDTA